LIVENIHIPFKENYLNAYFCWPDNKEELDEPIPVVVKFHGIPGYPPEKEAALLSEELTNNGVAFLSFNYTGVRDSPGIYSYYQAFENAEQIMTFLTHHKLINPRKIGVFGESLGGALAICHSARDPRVAALGLHAPLFDPSYVLGMSGFEATWQLLVDSQIIRFPPGNSRELFQKETLNHNPMDHIDLISPRPVAITCGKKDQIISYEGFLKLFDKAQDPKSILVIEEGNHYLNDKASAKEARDFLSKFFLDQFDW